MELTTEWLKSTQLILQQQANDEAAALQRTLGKLELLNVLLEKSKNEEVIQSEMMTHENGIGIVHE